MANKDNSVYHLKIDNFKNWPDIETLFNTQLSLQRYLDPDFGKPISLKEMAMTLKMHKHALDDEFSELMDALGGIHDGIGSAGWKWWKNDHKVAERITLDDLSPKDLLELKFEYVDLLHFVINIGLLLGMNGTEVMNMYLAKNRENIERQERGY